MKQVNVLVALLLLSWRVVAAETPYDHALSLYNSTDYAGAINQLHHETDAKSLVLLGQAYVMNSEFHRASDTLDRAVVLDPTNSVAQDWLGRAYGRRAETAFPISAISLATKARQAFERAVQLNSANEDALDDLFEFYIQAPAMLGGGADKARGLLPLIDRNDPAEGHYARARIHENQKEPGRAETEYRKAMEMRPDDVGRIVDLAKFFAGHGRTEESDRLFQAAEKKQPDSPTLMYARAETWIHQKRNLSQAAELLRRYSASTALTSDDPSRAEAAKLLKKASGD